MKKNLAMFSLLASVALLFTACGKKASVKKNLVEIKNYYPYVIVVADDGSAKENNSDINGIVSTISQLPGVKVVDRSNLDKVKEEMKFQDSDWSNDNKTVELGKVLNANIVCTITAASSLDYAIKFQDINTMATLQYTCNFATRFLLSRKIDFTPFSKVNTSANPFIEPVSFKSKPMEISPVKFQRKANAAPACPFGAEPNNPVTKRSLKKLPASLSKLADIKYMNFDLYEVVIGFNDGSEESYEFQFYPLDEPYITKKSSVMYTDGKIGSIDISGFIENCGIYKNTRNEIILLPFSTEGDGYGNCYWLPLKKS